MKKTTGRKREVSSTSKRSQQPDPSAFTQNKPRGLSRTVEPLSASPHSSSHRPSKRFGQNFLHDQGIVQKIVSALDPRSNETIVEIGPGEGALTTPLIEKAGRLIAVEFDRRLITVLTETFKDKQNFQLVESDALETDICELVRPAKTARLVANLPYNISTAILQRLVWQRHCLTEMVLMLQREVVERITAPAGSSERGYLSVLIEAYCETETLFDVAPGAFRPAPKVWSSVVRLTPRAAIAASVKDEELLWRVVSAGFAQRRKTILNNLRHAPPPLNDLVKAHGGASIILCQAEVELQRRAETLSLPEWARIVNVLN